MPQIRDKTAPLGDDDWFHRRTLVPPVDWGEAGLPETVDDLLRMARIIGGGKGQNLITCSAFHCVQCSYWMAHFIEVYLDRHWIAEGMDPSSAEGPSEAVRAAAVVEMSDSGAWRVQRDFDPPFGLCGRGHRVHWKRLGKSPMFLDKDTGVWHKTFGYN